MIKIDDVPENILKHLGRNNKEIVNTLIMDVINNSMGKNYIKISPQIFKAIVELKKYNYENIYYNAYTDAEREKLKLMLNTLFTKYLDDLNKNNVKSNIIKSYLNNMSEEYKNENSKERIVIDYIAGMTDDYCLNEYNKYLKSIHNKKEV